MCNKSHGSGYKQWIKRGNFKKKLTGDIYKAISTPCLDLGGRYMGVCFVFIHHTMYLCLMYFL